MTYQDVTGKREVLDDLLLNAILPNKWFNDVELKPEQESTESKAILIDIKGQFCFSRFINRIRDYYEKLIKRIAKEKGIVEFAPKQNQMKNFNEVAGVETSHDKLDQEFDAEKQQITENDYKQDKADFIRTCVEGLFVFTVMTPEEFAAVTRSLPSFFKKNRDIILICIDGLHSFEYKNIVDEESEAAEVNEIPNADDFFDKTRPNTPSSSSYLFKVRHRRGKYDSKKYEKELVEKSMAMIRELNKTYLFALIRFEGILNLKRVSQLIDDIVERGLVEKSDFTNSNNAMENTYNGIIETDDEVLKRKLLSMKYNEVLILRGDRANSLVPIRMRESEYDYDHRKMFPRHLNWFLKLFPRKLQDLTMGKNKFLKMFTLFVLYEKHDSFMQVADNVVRVSAMCSNKESKSNFAVFV